MLEKLRKEINEIDKSMLELISKRIKLGNKVAEAKIKEGDHVFFRPDREQDVLKRIKELNPGELDNVRLQNIFREIMGATLDIQESFKVAYLGPKGTFTHQAAQKKFGHSIELKPCADFMKVFDQVQKREVKYGIVPIENSIEGIVNSTLDYLLQFDLKIYSEVHLGIHNQLLSFAEDISSIEKIYTHRQPYGQCRNWIQKHLPVVEFHETSSTSKAVEIVAKQNNKKEAAIGSISASKVFNIPVLASNIEDYERNYTRFIIVSHETAKKAKVNRTSAMFAVHHEPGSLFEAIRPIYDGKINMTSIESRPYRSEPWNYIFYIDLIGHHEDEAVQKALDQLKKNTPFFKNLGSYPVDEDFS